MINMSTALSGVRYWRWPSLTILTKKKLSGRALYAIMETMEIQMNAGVEFGQILQGFLARAQKRGLYKREQLLIQRMISRVKAGGSLSDALKPHLTSTQYILLASGEQSGNVGLTMRLIMDLDGKKKRIITALKSSMTAPSIYLVTLVITLLVISLQVLPAMESILPASKWKGLAALIYDSTLLLKPAGLVLVFVAAVLLFLIVKLALPNWVGHGRLVAEKYVPGFALYRDYQGALWIGTFGAMLQAGMADTHILQTQITQSTPWMAERLRRILLLMKDGFGFGDAVVYAGPGRMDRARPDNGAKYDFPSPTINDDIANFAGFGGFEQKLLAMRDVWLTQQEKSIQSKLGLLGILVQAVVFGYFILLTLGINQLSSQISAAVGS